MNQPKAVSIFFLTEMWERYGFYLIQALLILFLLHRFHFDDQHSYAILGSVTALAYINSIIGGYIADQLIGHRVAVLIGALCLSLGYALIAFANLQEQVFASLALITFGTGLLKPNVSSMLGTLYKKNDSRRDSGFTLFYVGINFGIILATGLAGYLVEYFGWHFTFLTGTLVLLVAFITFYFGTHYFKIGNIRPLQRTPLKWLKAVVVALMTFVLSYYIIVHQDLALIAFFIITGVSIALVLYEAFIEKGRERRKLFAYLILVGLSVVYWAIYFQLFFSMNLFVLRAVDRHFFSLYVPPSIFLSIEAFGVIIFGPFMALLWTALKKSRFCPSTPMKFTLGLMMNAIAFGLLWISVTVLEGNGLVMPFWVVLVYLLIAVGELLLSPIGLAMVTELVPARLVGVMMGIFFISLGIGGKLAGLFADLSAIPQDLTDVPTIEAIYQHAFFQYFLISLLASILSFFLVPVIRRLINEAK